MYQKIEKFLVLIFLLLIITLIIFWSFVWNFGKIEVEANTPFTIEGLGKSKIECSTKCLQKVPTGVFDVTFLADSFQPIQARLEIRRFQTTSAQLKFTYQPILNKIGETLKEESLSFPIDWQENEFYAWNQTKDKLVYFEIEDKKYQLWEWEKTSKQKILISNFYDLNEPKIFWGTEKIIIQDLTQTFLVDLKQKIKTKLNLDAESQKLIFSPQDEKLFYEKQKQIWQYDFKTKKVEQLNLMPPLNSYVWKNETNLLYFKKTETGSDFYNYNLLDQKEHLLLQTNLKNPVNLKISKNKSKLLIEDQKDRFELILEESKN